MKLTEMDSDLRKLSRRSHGDTEGGATYLQNLLRAGQTDVEKLRLAAFLEHPDAQEWVRMSETEMPSLTLDQGQSWRAPESYWAEVLIQLAEPVHSRNELMSVGFDVMEYILENGDARSLVKKRLLEALSLVRNNPGDALQEVYDLTGLHHARYTAGAEMGMRNSIRALNGSAGATQHSPVHGLERAHGAVVRQPHPGAESDVDYIFRSISLSGKYSPELNVKSFISRLLMPDF